MKRRETVAVQIRATLANGGPIHGSTLTAWARDLDPDGAYCEADGNYANRRYERGLDPSKFGPSEHGASRSPKGS